MSKVNEVKYILLKIFYSIARALYREFIAIKKYISLHSLHSFIMNNIPFHKFKRHFQTGIISMILWSISSTCSESRVITINFLHSNTFDSFNKALIFLSKVPSLLSRL